MIQQFNRHQLIFGSISFYGGALVIFLSWVVIRAVLEMTMAFVYWHTWSPGNLALLVVNCLVGFGAWQWWRQGEKYLVFKDEPFHARLREHEGEEYVHIVTGPGDERVVGFRDLLAQVFFAGPKLMCAGAARYLSRIPESEDLEERMGFALEELRAKGTRQPALKYADKAEEVGALIRCGLVDFSLSKMLLKATSAAPPVSDQ